MHIRNKIFILIILVFLISWMDEFNKKENIIYALIIGTTILTIYIYIGMSILRKLAKYRKINKVPLRDSIIAGLIFGTVAHVYVYILFDADTKFFYPLEYTPAFTTFVTGSFFWHLMFWNRLLTVYNGIYVGILSVIVSHILFWCISILYIWIGESLSYGQTPLEFIIGLLGIIITLPVSAMTMVFVSSLFVPMIIITTIIIGGITGGLTAYVYKKKEMKIVNIEET